MKKPAIAIILAALAIHAQATEPFDIAITVDDLPAHGQLPPGTTRLHIAESYLATLKAHHVPEAFGFVNASKLKDNPDGAAVLDAWRKAGYPLGNHAWTHMNLARAASLDAWQADVIAGEPEVAARMKGLDWHWFRFPNLSAGGERGPAALAFLRTRGYQVADVSVAFGDWDYTDAYARCVAEGDQASIEAMKRHYFQRIDRGIAAMKVQSTQVFGRVIPQVLLTHLGGWSAVTLPEVMARLDAAGARYVTLARAQSDPAYALAGGGSLIARVAKEKGVKLAADPGNSAGPELDIKGMCR